MITQPVSHATHLTDEPGRALARPPRTVFQWRPNHRGFIQSGFYEARNNTNLQ